MSPANPMLEGGNHPLLHCIAIRTKTRKLIGVALGQLDAMERQEDGEIARSNTPACKQHEGADRRRARVGSGTIASISPVAEGSQLA